MKSFKNLFLRKNKKMTNVSNNKDILKKFNEALTILERIDVNNLVDDLKPLVTAYKIWFVENYKNTTDKLVAIKKKLNTNINNDLYEIIVQSGNDDIHRLFQILIDVDMVRVDNNDIYINDTSSERFSLNEILDEQHYEIDKLKEDAKALIVLLKKIEPIAIQKRFKKRYIRMIKYFKNNYSREVDLIVFFENLPRFDISTKEKIDIWDNEFFKNFIIKLRHYDKSTITNTRKLVTTASSVETTTTANTSTNEKTEQTEQEENVIENLEDSFTFNPQFQPEAEVESEQVDPVIEHIVYEYENEGLINALHQDFTTFFETTYKDIILKNDILKPHRNTITNYDLFVKTPVVENNIFIFKAIFTESNWYFVEDLVDSEIINVIPKNMYIKSVRMLTDYFGDSLLMNDLAYHFYIFVLSSLNSLGGFRQIIPNSIYYVRNCIVLTFVKVIVIIRKLMEHLHLPSIKKKVYPHRSIINYNKIIESKLLKIKYEKLQTTITKSNEISVIYKELFDNFT